MAEKTFNRSNFEQEVLQSDKPVIVDFWAPWCGPCQMMGPVIAQLADESEGIYEVGKVNVDDEQELAEKYGIMSIPAIKIFKDGQVTATSIGVTTPQKILKLLNQ